MERVFAISVFSEGDQGETILETFVQEGLTEGRNTDATWNLYQNTLKWYNDMIAYMDKKMGI